MPYPEPTLLGIHFGLDNCVVAARNARGSQIITDRSGLKTIPNVAARTNRGEWLVGQIANHQAVTNPEGTFRLARLFLGRHYEDVQDVLRLVDYRVVAGADGECQIELPQSRLLFVEVCAHVFAELRRNIRAQMGEDAAGAVITIPSEATPRFENVLEEAAKRAGLQVMGFLAEPVAVVKNMRSDKVVNLAAVINITPSAFDVSIVESVQGTMSPRLLRSDLRLGEKAFDEQLCNWLIASFQYDQGIDLSLDKMARWRVLDGAKRVMEDLVVSSSVVLDLPFIHEKTAMRMELTRTEVSNILRDLVQRAIGMARRSLFEADLHPGDVDDVIVVGNSPVVELLRVALVDEWKCNPAVINRPEEAKARGALAEAYLKWRSRVESEDRERHFTKSLSEEERLQHYLTILGLQGHIEPSEIHRAYREVVRQYHPDKVQQLGKELRDLAERKTKEINEAYEYLKKYYRL